MLTSPCYVDPVKPHFYLVKLGFIGVYFFLTFALKRRLWVLVTTAVLTCTHDLCFEQKKKNITMVHLKITFYTALNNGVYFIGVLS